MENQFIPKMYKKEQVTIRLPLETLEEVDSLAKKYRLSRSDFIAQCITFALAKMPLDASLNKTLSEDPKVETNE